MLKNKVVLTHNTYLAGLLEKGDVIKVLYEYGTIEEILINPMLGHALIWYSDYRIPCKAWL